MHIPDSFHERLRLEFGGRFRARWSPALQRVLIEEFITRGDPMGMKYPEQKMRMLQRLWPDRVIQALDGVHTVMQLPPAETLKCRCGSKLTLVANRNRSTKCDTCGHEHMLAYWTFGDALLQHLRSIDVDRGWYRDEWQEMDEEARTRLSRARQRLRGISRDMHKDDFTQLFGLPMVGGGRTTPYWSRT